MWKILLYVMLFFAIFANKFINYNCVDYVKN